MSVLLNEISKDLIFLNLDFNNKEEIIEFLANKLHQLGYVKNTYFNSVLNREQIYPTGLILNGYNVAIPHTESEYVYKSGIIVGRLNKPIVFKYMANPNQEVLVSLVIMLAIKNPKNHVPVLSELMTKLSNKELLFSLMNSDDISNFVRIITQ